MNVKETNLSSGKDPTIVEVVNWISNQSNLSCTFDEMLQWIVEGSPILDIGNETQFCDSQVLKEIIASKVMFDTLDLRKLYLARDRANLFESIGSEFFMNRASLKMANIDAATNFMFTNIDESPEHHRPLAPYYFADVCAGPGGFSEYVLWRKKWLFKGFGFTLKAVHNFELSRSRCASPATFNAQYGFYKDGDIFKLENITSFAKNVKHETEGLGVHFMMSDGAFSVDGNENLQEVLSKQIYLCQCLTALEIVRSNGHFVTKLFDLFTPFSVGLVYLMYKCFEKVTILKPNSSRPGNAERYLICYGLQQSEQTDLIKNYLTNIATKLWQIRCVDGNNTIDVNEIVPLNLLKGDEDFCNYIMESNNRIGKQQSASLRKLEKYYHDTDLDHTAQQEEVRLQCLKYWNIPESLQVIIKEKYTLDDLLALVNFRTDLMNNQGRIINTLEELKIFLRNSSDLCYVLSGSNCNFYAAIDDSNVWRLQQSKWVKVNKLKLIVGTVLFGEMIKEKIIVDNGRKTVKQCLHVIDALRLGHKSLIDLSFSMRMENIKIFCEAVNHESRLNHIRIRAKSKFEMLTPTMVDDHSSFDLPILGYKSRRESYHVNSVIFLNSNKDLVFHESFSLQQTLALSKIAAYDNDETITKLAFNVVVSTISDCR